MRFGVYLSTEGDYADASLLAEVGCCLFESLFPPSIATVYRRSLEQARGSGHGLRIHLRLEAPELAGLPWEYLCDRQEDCFLAVSPETPLVRYVPMPYPAQPVIRCGTASCWPTVSALWASDCFSDSDAISFCSMSRSSDCRASNSLVSLAWLRASLSSSI